MSTLRVCGLIAALALAVTAMAYPTLTGPTGLVAIPTANTAGSGITVAADWLNIEDGHAIPIQALIGLGKNAELGAAYDTFSDTEFKNAWGVNAKYGFGDIFKFRPAIGAQFMRITGREISIDDSSVEPTIDFTQAYLAFTRVFAMGDQSLGLTLGANWTKAKAEIGDLTTIDEDAIRGNVGVDLMLTPMLSVVAEYQTRSSKVGDEHPLSSIAARVKLNKMFTLQVGSTNALGPVGFGDHQFFAGLDFNFGSR